jgi:hypothetical protein
MSGIRLNLGCGHRRLAGYGVGNQLGQELEPLGSQFAHLDADPGPVAAGPSQSGDQPKRSDVRGREQMTAPIV